MSDSGGRSPVPGHDPFLRELLELEGAGSEREFGHGLSRLTEALDRVAPPQSSCDRLLASVPQTGRFERFAAAVAGLLDIGIEPARALLDMLDDPARYSRELPGIAFFWVEGGPRVANAVRGFLRVDAGTDFPEHEHLGEETVLVLQGSYIDESRGVRVRPGDIDVMPAQSAHCYVIPKDGPDLLLLSVTQVGLRVHGATLSPR